MTSSDSKVARIQTHFQTLSSLAPKLNSASDELTQSVGVLDDTLKKLNIGLSAWVTFRSRGVEEWEYDDDQIGYDKVEGRWGIALRRIWGDHNAEHFGGDGPWLFNDAPRNLRLLAVDKLPELIEALSKVTSDTTKKIQEKTKQVRELADAIEQLSNDSRVTTRGISPPQVVSIISDLQRQQKFLGEVITHASGWELDGSDLRISFPSHKKAFAELLEGRDALAKLRSVVQEILGIPVQVTVRLQPRTEAASQRASSGSGKVQK